MMDFPIYLKYRISMIFILIFMMQFLPLRYSKSKSIGIAVLCFVRTGMVDYAHLMAEGITVGMRLMYQIMLIVLVQGTALLMSKYRDFRALFVGISASAFVLGGDMVWNLTLMYSGNVYLAFAVQIAVHCFSMALMIHTVRDALLEEQTEKDTPWLLYSSAPALYYLLAYTVVFQNENSFDHIDVNPLAVVYMILLLLVSLIALAKLYDVSLDVLIGRQAKDDEAEEIDETEVDEKEETDETEESASLKARRQRQLANLRRMRANKGKK